MDTKIDDFISITGSDRTAALHMLEACNNNLEMAVSMHLDNKNTTSSNTPTSSNLNQNNDDNIRAPIPQTRGVLVETDYSTTSRSNRWTNRRPHSVFDGFRDFKEETKLQESLSSSNANSKKKLKRLEDLFRPPLELMHRGTLETARTAGAKENKWLIVNVQNVKEFSCQVLNRDVWSNDRVQKIIKNKFLFWQVYSDSAEGEHFMTFYPVSEWPHVSILDPRTGEQLVKWRNVTTESFCENIAKFLLEHGQLGEDEEDEPPSKKSKRDNSIVDESEDAQLKAAIEASLKESAVSNEDETLYFNDFESASEFEPSTDEEEPNNNEKNISDDKQEKSTNNYDDKNTNNHLNNKKVSNSTNGLNNDETNHSSEKLSKTCKKMIKIHPKHENLSAENNKLDMCNILLRLPDGKRDKIILNRNSNLKTLCNRVQFMGYPQDQFELITNFPKRNLSLMDDGDTLEDAGLYPRGTVFVQEL